MNMQTARKRNDGLFGAVLLRPLKAIAAGSALGLVAFGAAAEEAAPAPAFPVEVTDRIDQLFTSYQTDKHVPGLVWGIVKDGELVYFKPPVWGTSKPMRPSQQIPCSPSLR